jgi:hypothetical protein
MGPLTRSAKQTLTDVAFLRSPARPGTLKSSAKGGGAVQRHGYPCVAPPPLPGAIPCVHTYCASRPAKLHSSRRLARHFHISRIRKRGRIGCRGKILRVRGGACRRYQHRDISAHPPVVTFPWRAERNGLSNFVSCGQFKDPIVQLDPLDTDVFLGSGLASDM